MDKNEEGVIFEGNQAEGQSDGQVPNTQVKPGQTEQPKPTQESPAIGLTKDELLQIIEERSNATLTESKRFAQSLVSKSENRFRERIGDIQERAKKLGLGENDPAVQEQINIVKREALKEEINPEGIEEQLPAQDAEPENPLAGYVQQRQEAISKEFGVVVGQNDPEAQNIQHETMEGFLLSYKEAAQAKKERIEKEGQLQGAPAGRLGNLGSGGAPGNPIAEINDPRELFKRAFNR